MLWSVPLSPPNSLCLRDGDSVAGGEDSYFRRTARVVPMSRGSLGVILAFHECFFVRNIPEQGHWVLGECQRGTPAPNTPHPCHLPAHGCPGGWVQLGLLTPTVCQVNGEQVASIKGTLPRCAIGDKMVYGESPVTLCSSWDQSACQLLLRTCAGHWRGAVGHAGLGAGGSVPPAPLWVVMVSSACVLWVPSFCLWNGVSALSVHVTAYVRRQIRAAPQGWRPPGGGHCRGGRGEAPNPTAWASLLAGAGERAVSGAERGGSSREVRPGLFLFPPTHSGGVGIPACLEAFSGLDLISASPALVTRRGAAGGKDTRWAELAASSRPLRPHQPPRALAALSCSGAPSSCTLQSFTS